jgi:hypothetical protein
MAAGGSPYSCAAPGHRISKICESAAKSVARVVRRDNVFQQSIYRDGATSLMKVDKRGTACKPHRDIFAFHQIDLFALIMFPACPSGIDRTDR